MKKLMGVLLAACLLAAGLWYYVRTPLRTVDPDRALPADALLTLECRDLKERLAKFRSSPLGKKLGEIDFVAAMKKLEAPPRWTESYRNFESRLKASLQSQLFEEIFGRRAVLAWLPDQEALIEFDDSLDLLRQMVLVAQPRSRIELVELAGKILSRDLVFTFEGYKDCEIRRFELRADLPVYYTLAKGLLIAASSRENIIRCIDQLETPDGALVSVPNYQKLRPGKAGRVNTLVYGNIEGFLDILNSRLKEDAEFQKKASLFKGLKHFGLVSFQDERIQDHLRILFDAQALDPRNVPLYSRAPEIHQPLAWAPENPLLYYSVNTMDLNLKLQRDLADAALREAVADRFIKMTQMHPDKLIDSLGHQFGLVIEDLRGGGVLPGARIAVFIELNETGPMNRLLRSAAEQFNTELSVQQKNGIDIHTLPLPLTGDFQPAFAFYRGFCLLASNGNTIADIIEKGENASGLANNPEFEAVLKGRPDAVNSLSYLKTDRMMDAIRELLEWSRRMAGFQDAQRAAKLTILTDEVIFPLLEGLKMYQSMGSFTQLKDGEMEAYSFTRVATEAKSR